jgi:hypothetical protein
MNLLPYLNPWRSTASAALSVWPAAVAVAVGISGAAPLSANIAVAAPASAGIPAGAPVFAGMLPAADVVFVIVSTVLLPFSIDPQ